MLKVSVGKYAGYVPLGGEFSKFQEHARSAAYPLCPRDPLKSAGGGDRGRQHLSIFDEHVLLGGDFNRPQEHTKCGAYPLCSRNASRSPKKCKRRRQGKIAFLLSMQPLPPDLEIEDK